MIIFIGDIKIDKSTDWKPQYNIFFTIILIIVFTLTLAIPILYTIKKIYSLITIDLLKKKIRFFTIGIIGNFSYLYFIFIYNSTKNFLIRLIWLIYSPSLLIFAYFLYKGYIKSLDYRTS